MQEDHASDVQRNETPEEQSSPVEVSPKVILASFSVFLAASRQN